MAEMVKVCNCDKCGNEAEMTITCKKLMLKNYPASKRRCRKRRESARSVETKPT